MFLGSVTNCAISLGFFPALPSVLFGNTQRNTVVPLRWFLQKETNSVRFLLQKSNHRSNDKCEKGSELHIDGEKRK